MHKARQDYRFGAEYQDKLRAKIKTGMVLGALVEHALGKKEMSASQVTAALGLLRKALPDLNATELSGNVTTYQDTLRRVAEQMGWAVAASQVRNESVDTGDDAGNAAPHTSDNESDATSDATQGTD